MGIAWLQSHQNSPMAFFSTALASSFLNGELTEMLVPEDFLYKLSYREEDRLVVVIKEALWSNRHIKLQDEKGESVFCHSVYLVVQKIV
ncbi:6967_t:CDS:2 [Funneliformis caledonium]|uniref:6967_t:CDS:1 n=1 Tax=Funneliformis caledonium TaxID=1117310 RepID=A0A9N9G2E9_9GLOM|nr:6967_t:CDS:2 [Funneliformis caledonium]